MAAVGSSGSVIRTNLISQSFANVWNILNDRDNVADPLDALGGRKLLYAKIPNTSARDFEGYPFIVIRRAVTDLDNMSLSATRGEMGWEFDVEVRSSNNIRDHQGNGAYYCEVIMDAILATINNTINRSTLRNYGMAHAMPTVEDFDSISIGTDSVFFGRLTIPFSSRLILST